MNIKNIKKFSEQIGSFQELICIEIAVLFESKERLYDFT